MKATADRFRWIRTLFVRCAAPLALAGMGLSLWMPCVLHGEDPDAGPTDARTTQAQRDFFEAKIRPILKEHCWECHARDSQSVKGGLLLDSRQAVLRGGDSGPAAMVGKLTDSLIISAIHYNELQMPPQSRLPPSSVALLEKWVGMGLPWGATVESSTPELDKDGIVDSAQIAAGKNFWSLQPLSTVELPPVSDTHWPRTRIDYFVLAGLDDAGLRPAMEADKRALIRRLSFDLVGLPPTWKEVECFSADQSSTSYEQLVERLLASPGYGQRWGRHWLDVVRYAEDHPNGALPPRYPHLYRDWVVGALNVDLPYDEFLSRQLAADQMEGLPLEELAALGFLGLSPTYLIDEKFSKEVVESIKADEWEDKVDVVTRGLLGLTVACARCHDHKYDPITSADYYALAGVMASTQLVETPTVPLSPEDRDNISGLTEQLRFHETRYESRYKQRQGLIKDGEPDIYRYDKEILESASEIQRIKSLLPDNYESIPRVNAVRDAAEHVNPESYVIRELVSPEAKFWRTVEYTAGKARDLPIHIRGSVTNLGEPIPRRYISVLSTGSPLPFRHGSGRRELAEAIVGQSRHLTGRVIVNRVWGWHFGSHLVGTPSNFGALGDRPSHPELLDDLTLRFVEQGWSLKQLHREIVLSATYRQSSRFDEASYLIDPANAHYWRMNSRRLEVEAWRDAMLQVSGGLDANSGGESFDVDDLGQSRRTLYAKTSRQVAATLLKLFDFPQLTRHAESRSVTTTPLQQLYFMNSPFVLRHAEMTRDAHVDVSCWESSVMSCYHAILQREPSELELQSAREFVGLATGADRETAWLMLVQSLLTSNEFLFVE